MEPLNELDIHTKRYSDDEKKSRKDILSEILKDLSVAEFASNYLGLNIVKNRGRNQRYVKTYEYSSLVFDLQKNKAYWNAKTGSTPLNAIDLLMEHENISGTEAANIVIEYYKARDPRNLEIFKYDVQENKSNIVKGLELPKSYENNESVRYYLTETRQLSEAIVDRMIDKGLIYEDINHNAVFIGMDVKEFKEPIFGFRRGTNAIVKFQKDCLGSFKLNGFFIEGAYSIKKLVVTESVIDGLSYASIHRKNIDAHILASSGAGVVANTLWYNLNVNPKLKDIKELVVALDNDEAGKIATTSIIKWCEKNRPNLKVSIYNYEGKDLNENLVNLRQTEDNEILKQQLNNENSDTLEKESISIDQDELEK